MEPRCNETVYNEDLGITNDFLYPSNGKTYEKEPRYSEQILPVAWPFVISRFHCTKKGYHPLVSLPRLHLYNARPSEEYLCGATLEACEWGRERGQGLGNFPFTLVGDSGTKVQPNGQKARHWLVNELVTKLKRLTVMLQNERNEVTAKRINSRVE